MYAHVMKGSDRIAKFEIPNIKINDSNGIIFEIKTIIVDGKKSIEGWDQLDELLKYLLSIKDGNVNIYKINISSESGLVAGINITLDPPYCIVIRHSDI